MWWSEYEPLDAVNAKDLSDSTTFLELTGAGKFVGMTKKTWVRNYMDLSDDDPALNCFVMLGESHLPTTMNGTELPEQVKPLEHFVCRAYSPKGPTTLPALR